MNKAALLQQVKRLKNDKRFLHGVVAELQKQAAALRQELKRLEHNHKLGCERCDDCK